MRTRVLFVAEAVTLAHVARPLVLARALDPDRCEICLACDPRYDALLGPRPFAVRPITSMPSRRFLARLARGTPAHDAATLRAYVREDLDVLREFRPDVVVGDMRLSLAVSSRLAGVPYLALFNAYWSPFARVRFPLPEVSWARFVPQALGDALFRLARPVGFALQAAPLNRVLREHGLPGLGWDLRRVYTHGDHTLYPDVPELVPTRDLPPNHHYLGPLVWSPAGALPDWWERLPEDRPVVYVTLGSSGRADLLPVVLAALAGLPVSVAAATAGRAGLLQPPANAFLADYLPGEAACRRASLVVCNGGSPTSQQALAAGRPVLGLVSILDQHLNMQAVTRAGAGEAVRAEQADVPRVRAAVERLLAEVRYRAAAEAVAAVYRRYDAAARFRAVLASVVGV